MSAYQEIVVDSGATGGDWRIELAVLRLRDGLLDLSRYQELVQDGERCMGTGLERRDGRFEVWIEPVTNRIEEVIGADPRIVLIRLAQDDRATTPIVFGSRESKAKVERRMIADEVPRLLVRVRKRPDPDGGSRLSLSVRSADRRRSLAIVRWYAPGGSLWEAAAASTQAWVPPKTRSIQVFAVDDQGRLGIHTVRLAGWPSHR